MVYRKRRTYKRRTPKRTYRKRFSKRTRYSKKGQKLYLFKRNVDFGLLIIDNINPTFIAYNFSLSDIPSVIDFTRLYDVYKLNAVKITFRPQMTQNISLGTINNANANARFFSALDYNDGTPVTTIDELREYQSVKCTPILRQHKRYLRPKIVDSAGIYNPGSKWIATTSPATDYFGIKVAVEPMDSSGVTSMQYSIECVYYMSFKNVK